MVACPATRSVSALPRAASMWVHTPSLTYRCANASIAAHAVAASSDGKVPSHRSTPGSATHRRRPHSARARLARCQQQLRADPRQSPPAPAPQVRPVLDLEVPLEHRHHRLAHLRRGRRQLVGDHTRPVRVQPALTHRRVQPTQPAVRARPLGAVRRQQHRRLDPPLGVHRRAVQHPGQDRRGVQRHVPGRLVRLHHGAVLAPLRLDRRQAHDRLVLRRGRDVEHLLQRPHRRRPLRPGPDHTGRHQHGTQRGHRGIRRSPHLTRPDHHRAHPLPLLLPCPICYPKPTGGHRQAPGQTTQSGCPTATFIPP